MGQAGQGQGQTLGYDQTAPSLKTAGKNEIKVRGQLELSFLRNKPNIFTVHKA